MPNKAVFLDRDGTLNPDPGYISHPDDFSLFPEVPEALSALKSAGFLLILVTNQSGIGRKIIKPQNLCKIHDKLQKLLFPNGKIDRFYICPHSPEVGCSCRKPLPGLILKAISELNIDPKSSFLIGDRDTDIQTAISAGIFPILISPSPSQIPKIKQVSNFTEAVDFILNQEKLNSK